MQKHSFPKKYLLASLIALFAIFTISAEELMVVSGYIKNAKNKKKIENVSLTVPGSNIGTVTNSEGYFSLKIPQSLVNKGIKAEQIGFQSKTILPTEYIADSEFTIFLEPSSMTLKEFVVLGGEPREIVERALEQIPDNYADHDNLFSGFYRETIKKGNRFISISEAMVDVLKKSYYRRVIDGEKVSIKRGRKLMSPKPADTLGVKIAGGPFMSVALDAVKNGEHLFKIDEMKYFDFKMEKPELIDDRPHYVISFKPNTKLSYPLHKGVMFIDGETLALSRVEFALDMSDKNKVTHSILQKKPRGLYFKPEEVSGVVTYKLIDGKSYLNYINSTIKFKCDWKKKLFSSSYTTNTEMVMVDRDNNPDKRLKMHDPFGQYKIFSDIVDNYWDKDFWDEYNIIEPTESLEKAVDKLKKSKAG